MQIGTFDEFYAKYTDPQTPAYQISTEKDQGLVFRRGAFTSNYHGKTRPAWGMPPTDDHAYLHPAQVLLHLGEETLWRYKMLWAREHLREAQKAQVAMYPLRAWSSSDATGSGLINTHRCGWSDWLHVLGEPPDLPDPFETVLTAEQQVESSRAEWQAVIDKVAEHQAYYDEMKAKYNALHSVVSRQEQNARHKQAMQEIDYVRQASHKAVRSMGIAPVNL